MNTKLIAGLVFAGLLSSSAVLFADGTTATPATTVTPSVAPVTNDKKPMKKVHRHKRMKKDGAAMTPAATTPVKQ